MTEHKQPTTMNFISSWPADLILEFWAGGAKPSGWSCTAPTDYNTGT